MGTIYMVRVYMNGELVEESIEKEYRVPLRYEENACAFTYIDEVICEYIDLKHLHYELWYPSEIWGYFIDSNGREVEFKGYTDTDGRIAVVKIEYNDTNYEIVVEEIEE